VLEEAKLRANLELMKQVKESAGCQIILAFKGFSMWSAFPMVREYLDGATASSLNEALLCVEKMKNKAHTYSPAYLPSEFSHIMKLSSHITFNSLTQYELYKESIKNHTEKISCGLRVNPEYSVVETDLYNPCTPGTRLGIGAEYLDTLPEGIEGLHFHALCESTSYDLENALQSFEYLFSKHFDNIKWVNFGGGHLMTRKGYNVEHLIQTLKNFKAKYPHLQVILEPGSAAAWQTGNLTSSVLDIVEHRGIKTAILDISFTCHMPDCLEMPYKPVITGSIDPKEQPPHLYRMGGVSCLSGDYIGDYGFNLPLKVGDRIVFEDMIHYTMVKTTMFNGVTHPDIAIWRENGKLEIIRKFTYQDYRDRLS